MLTHQNTLHQYKYLLFDLDNTLLDYNQAEDIALSSTFKDLHITDDWEAIKSVYNKINLGYWRAFEEKKIKLEYLKTARFQDLIDNVPALQHLEAQLCSDTYLHYLSEQIHLITGAIELLEKLHGKFNLSLVTNGIAMVQHRRICKSGFDRYFKDIFISEEIGYSKPDPAFFYHALGMLGKPAPWTVLVVGDNLLSDIGGAMNVGLDACWFNPSQMENNSDILPTFIISQLSDLINILTL
jgi:2-haloacid dehalogenase